MYHPLCQFTSVADNNRFCTSANQIILAHFQNTREQRVNQLYQCLSKNMYI